LFLGGPFGTFFRDLSYRLAEAGASVLHVNMHGGDELDWGRDDAIYFRESPSVWPTWFAEQLSMRGISDVVSYGDCGYYIREALTAAERAGIVRHVFELGYFRPDWITLERGGVNGFSGLPRDPDYYRSATVRSSVPVERVGLIAPFRAAYGIRYALAYHLGRNRFPQFTPSWLGSPGRQVLGHTLRVAKGPIVRPLHRWLERRIFEDERSFFLCTLQRPGDSQISCHSKYHNMAEFIDEVADDFAVNAPENHRLVFKAHPLDIGAESHRRTVHTASKRLKLGDRLVFLPSGSLSRLTERAEGIVTISSTTGLAALVKNRPVKTLGRAFYDMAGLTHQGSLKSFWNNPTAPDRSLCNRFRSVVMNETQINGCYFSPKGKRIALPEATRHLLERNPAKAA